MSTGKYPFCEKLGTDFVIQQGILRIHFTRHFDCVV